MSDSDETSTDDTSTPDEATEDELSPGAQIARDEEPAEPNEPG